MATNACEETEVAGGPLLYTIISNQCPGLVVPLKEGEATMRPI